MHKIEERILRLLEKSLWGHTITEVANKIGISRTTASKYLEVLNAKGLIISRRVGAYRLWLSRDALEKRFQLISRLFIQALGETLNETFNEKANIISLKLAKRIGFKIRNDLIRYIGERPQINPQDVVLLISDEVGSKIEYIERFNNTSILRVHNCLCNSREHLKPTCNFISGLIIGILESIFRREIDVKEVKCMISGFNYCEHHIIFK